MLNSRGHCSVLLALFVFACGISMAAPSADRCAICGAEFGTVVYTVTDELTHEKIQVCHTCATWPDVCFLCGLAARAGSVALPDGRFLCARDAKTAVLDDGEARQICVNVQDALERLFSRFTTFPSTNVDIQVVDRVNLMALFQVPGHDFECPNILGYAQIKTNEGQTRYTVSLMSALPRPRFKAVCAHEYTHCWVAANVSTARRKALNNSAEEGFCELVAYLLMGSLGDAAEQEIILGNHYSRGQIQLFVEAEKRYGFNEILDWMKFGVDSQLRSDDLNRIRDVDLPAVPRPIETSPNYAIASLPGPDTLVLRGITWISGQPLASINNRSFAPGESGKVQLGTSNVTIRCLSITTNTARVQIAPAGAEQELKLSARR